MIIIIPLILIFLSLVAIFIIIARKFPILALLDIKSMPEEKEAKFKKKIIQERFDRDWQNMSQKLTSIFKKPFISFNGFSKKINKNLKEKKYKYQAYKRLSFTKRNQKISKIIQDISDLINSGNYSQAEEKAIYILTFDSHNQQAFEKLGEIYLSTKKYQEAKETYEFLLKLFKEKEQSAEEANTYYLLAEIAEKTGDLQQSIEFLSKALEIQKNQPKFLNKLLEIYIGLKQEKEAKEVFSLLASVNSENKKLLDWEEKIKQISFDKKD